ncbi:CACNA1H [Symbiodinium natans]|uniref:CACNA1H protein n=1 Tax=Symbiodinium natans TaxID=878477 RepID=A0A812L4Y0_9DINO|nr:CACNA1H [Symbiodinium natans]
MTSNETFHDINEMQRCATLCSSLARIAEMLDSCLCPAMDVKCDEQKDQMQQLVEEVLQKQHNALLLRLELWLSKLDEQLPQLPPKTVTEWTRQVTPAVSNRISGSSARGRRRSETAEEDKGEEKPLRRSIHSEDYELAQSEADRIESMKNLAMASRQTSKTRTRLQSWARRTQQRAARMASSLAFNIFFSMVIVSNSVFLGLQLEWSARQVDQLVEPVFLAGHLIYASLFSVEMLIRLVASGPKTYLFGHSCAWNWLDIFVVVPAWIEITMDVMSANATDAGTGASNFRIIRVFKLTRLLQVLRSVRIVRFVSAFRALVYSVIDTTRQLLWAMVLLMLIIYSFGILFTDAVLYHLFWSGEADEGHLKMYFGSVMSSCNTLFRALMNGFDWSVAADALLPLGDFWVQLFHLYIAFCGLAVLNVITGVFVNSAIKTREKDHETLMQNMYKLKDLVGDLWKKLDKAGAGKITITEFERMFEEEDMRAFFGAIEMNAMDAWTLFDSLDADGDHLISFEEFKERCLQLHGPARSVDLFALKQQNNKLWEELMALQQGTQQVSELLVSLGTVVSGTLGGPGGMESVELKWPETPREDR